jgi:hypothetical protein
MSTTIIVGRLQAAIDIMEKEGASTVDRPHNISAGETLSGGMRVLLTPAGERFKKMRRCVYLLDFRTLPFLTLNDEGHYTRTCSPKAS